jgi:hypothetical protein
MQSLDLSHVTEAICRFQTEGKLVDVRPLERGHIHDTFVSRWQNKGNQCQFIHQRMNGEVFPDLERLMENIHTVSEHMVERLVDKDSDGFEPLQLVPTKDNQPFAQSESGAWRTYVFIENTSSFDRCQSEDQAYEAARAFGWFQSQLRDLAPDRLHITLDKFFDSQHRYSQFQQALAGATTERKQAAAGAIEFAMERRGMVDVMQLKIESGMIPTRVIHGDTKLNNILFDNDTGKAKGIVDLDTCMPGYSLYDFGDLARFTAARTAEDETDQSLIGTDLTIYKALAEGYLSTAGGFLTPKEIELMPFAAQLVTFTIGLRFLADYLSGDTYFKIDRPNQNLDRTRVQFGMVDFMEQHANKM